MAKSSIKFDKKYFFEHNDRTQKEEPKYLLPKGYRLGNEFDYSAKQAKKRLADFTANAEKNMREKFNQELQAKSFVWEAVINLNENHTLENLKKAVKKLEKETGFKSIQMSIHRDEGHIKKDKNGNDIVIYNFHAHVTFFTLDQYTGQQLYRKDISPSLRKKYREKVEAPFKLNIPTNAIKILAPKEKRKKSVWGINDQNINVEIRKQFKADGHIVFDREKMSSLQTVIAEELGMVRGTVSVKHEADKLGVEVSRPAPGLGHKAHKAREQAKERIKKKARKLLKEERVKVKDVTEANKSLKDEMKELGISGRAIHARVEAIIRTLRDKARAKSLTVTGLEKEMQELRAELLKTQTENQILKEENDEHRRERTGEYKRAIDRTKQSTRDLSTATGGDISGATEAYQAKRAAAKIDEVIERAANGAIKQIDGFLEELGEVTVDNLLEQNRELKEQEKEPDLATALAIVAKHSMVDKEVIFDSISKKQPTIDDDYSKLEIVTIHDDYEPKKALKLTNERAPEYQKPVSFEKEIDGGTLDYISKKASEFLHIIAQKASAEWGKLEKMIKSKKFEDSDLSKSDKKQVDRSKKKNKLSFK